MNHFGAARVSFIDCTYEEALVYVTELDAISQAHSAAGVDTPDEQCTAIEMTVSLADDMVRRRITGSTVQACSIHCTPTWP